MLWRILFQTYLRIHRALHRATKIVESIAERIRCIAADILDTVGRFLERRYVVELLEEGWCGYQEFRYLGLDDLEMLAKELSGKGFIVAKIVREEDDYPCTEITLVRGRTVVQLVWRFKVVEKTWIQCREDGSSKALSVDLDS